MLRTVHQLLIKVSAVKLTGIAAILKTAIEFYFKHINADDGSMLRTVYQLLMKVSAVK